MPFDVTIKLKGSLEHSLRSAQECISTEELRVTRLLDDFVNDEVSERISERRAKVSDIWGAGTTNKQSTEVRDFYKEVEALLSEALSTHLKARSEEFGKFLLDIAEVAPRHALNEVHVLMEQATDNILAAATAVVADQKEAVQSQIAAIETACIEPLRMARDLRLTATALSHKQNKLGTL